jgi:hypothetical protein
MLYFTNVVFSIVLFVQLNLDVKLPIPTLRFVWYLGQSKVVGLVVVFQPSVALRLCVFFVVLSRVGTETVQSKTPQHIFFLLTKRPFRHLKLRTDVDSVDIKEPVVVDLELIHHTFL